MANLITITHRFTPEAIRLLRTLCEERAEGEPTTVFHGLRASGPGYRHCFCDYEGSPETFEAHLAHFADQRTTDAEADRRRAAELAHVFDYYLHECMVGEDGDSERCATHDAPWPRSEPGGPTECEAAR